MSLSDAVRKAQEVADTSTDPADHRVKLALEAALAAEDAAEKRLIDPPAAVDLEDVPPPPVAEIRIKKPPPPTGDLPTGP